MCEEKLKIAMETFERIRNMTWDEVLNGELLKIVDEGITKINDVGKK